MTSSRAHPEWDLQVLLVKAVRAHVPQPHVFFSVDRAQKSSITTHMRQKARGMIAGTSDTWLLCPSFPAISIELKARGEKVEKDSTQERFGLAARAAGHLWGWTDSVFGYFRLLVGFGVPLVGNWQLTAMNYDALLESAEIRREETKTGKVSKRRVRAAKPTAAQVKASERVRARVLF